MKKKQIKLLRIKKIKVANLSVLNLLKGGEKSADVNNCETNTNTDSNFCPPETFDCPSHVLNGCPPDVDTRNDCSS